MASIITLDGAGSLGVTNEYGEQLPATSVFGWGDAAQTFVGWGIVAFALGTAAYRLRDAFAGTFGRRQYRPTREDMQGLGRHRRRRRR